MKMSDEWERKMGLFGWDKETLEERGDSQDEMETIPEAAVPQTILEPTADTGTLYLMVAGIIAALGVAMLVLFKSDNEEEKKKPKKKARVPKIITKTKTVYVEREPEKQIKEPKKKVVKEETEETEDDII